jgi:hypothetical protein
LAYLSQWIELEKAANDRGFEVIEPRLDGSVALASSDVEAQLIVSADDAGFLVSIDDGGLARELAAEGRYEPGGPQTFLARRPDVNRPIR